MTPGESQLNETYCPHGIAEPAPVPGPRHSGSGLTDLCYSSFPLGVKWSDTIIGRASEAGTAISQ